MLINIWDKFPIRNVIVFVDEVLNLFINIEDLPNVRSHALPFA